MRSSVGHRSSLLVMLVALLIAIPVVVLGQGTTSTTYIKGTVTTSEPLALSPSAVAVITLVDRSARGGSGVILGQKRIGDPGTTPISYSIRYDPARIQADHAYVVFAAILDGAKQWQNADGVPVITGGPTSGVAVPVKKLPSTPVATIPGQIAMEDQPSFTGKEVAIAAVLDLDTGRAIAWTVITPFGSAPIDFQLGYDPALLAPGTRLGGWAGVVDKLKVWESPQVTPLLVAGPQLSAGSILVTPATPLPAAPEPTPTPTPVTIPNVRNQPEAAAANTLRDADLVVGDTVHKYHASVEKGLAVKTSPEAGMLVPPESAVKLVISSGPSPSPSPAPTPKPTPKPTPTPTAAPGATPTPVAIPDVRDLSEADAVIELTDAGLKIGERPKRYSDKIKAGNAIKTDPEAGVKVKPATPVDLYISKGPEPTPSPSPTPTPKPTPVVVPDVRGLSEADAVVDLSDADLKVGDRYKRSDQTVRVGAVIKTDPAGGAKVQPGSRVDLFVSTGPAPTPSPSPVVVPDVRDLPEPDAIIELTDADLEIGERVRQVDEDVEAGSVIGTDPEPGSRVPPGTIVDLTVSNGPAPTPTPIPTPAPTRTPLPTLAPTPSPSLPWPYPSEGTGILSGVLVYRQATEPGDLRQVVVTLVEQSASGSRVIPTTQYVNEGSPPLGFAVTYDWAEIDPSASYRVLAAVMDGEDSWATRGGAPAITQGAPVAGLVVTLYSRSDILEGEVSGIIVGVADDLSPVATREAFLVRGDTGAVVAYDAAPVEDTPIQRFSVPFLLSDIDPSVEYLVVARVIDGLRIWTGPGVPVVTQGAPFRVVVPVAAVSGPTQPLDAPDP